MFFFQLKFKKYNNKHNFYFKCFNINMHCCDADIADANGDYTDDDEADIENADEKLDEGITASSTNDVSSNFRRSLRQPIPKQTHSSSSHFDDIVEDQRISDDCDDSNEETFIPSNDVSEGSEDLDSEDSTESSERLVKNKTLKKKQNTKIFANRIKWSEDELKILNKEFRVQICNKAIPNTKDINSCIGKFPILCKRSIPQIKARVQYIIKKS